MRNIRVPMIPYIPDNPQQKWQVFINIAPWTISTFGSASQIDSRLDLMFPEAWTASDTHLVWSKTLTDANIRTPRTSRVPSSFGSWLYIDFARPEAFITRSKTRLPLRPLSGHGEHIGEACRSCGGQDWKGFEHSVSKLSSNTSSYKDFSKWNTGPNHWQNRGRTTFVEETYGRYKTWRSEANSIGEPARYYIGTDLFHQFRVQGASDVSMALPSASVNVSRVRPSRSDVIGR